MSGADEPVSRSPASRTARRYTFSATVDDDGRHRRRRASRRSVVPRTVPGAPTAVTAVPADISAAVSFAAPASDGGDADHAVHGHLVTGRADRVRHEQPDQGAGLHNGTSYTFTVTATNSAGTGPASAPSAPSSRTRAAARTLRRRRAVPRPDVPPAARSRPRACRRRTTARPSRETDDSRGSATVVRPPAGAPCNAPRHFSASSSSRSVRGSCSPRLPGREAGTRRSGTRAGSRSPASRRLARRAEARLGAHARRALEPLRRGGRARGARSQSSTSRARRCA